MLMLTYYAQNFASVHGCLSFSAMDVVVQGHADIGAILNTKTPFYQAMYINFLDLLTEYHTGME